MIRPISRSANKEIRPMSRPASKESNQGSRPVSRRARPVSRPLSKLVSRPLSRPVSRPGSRAGSRSSIASINCKNTISFNSSTSVSFSFPFEDDDKEKGLLPGIVFKDEKIRFSSFYHQLEIAQSQQLNRNFAILDDWDAPENEVDKYVWSSPIKEYEEVREDFLTSEAERDDLMYPLKPNASSEFSQENLLSKELNGRFVENLLSKGLSGRFVENLQSKELNDRFTPNLQPNEQNERLIIENEANSKRRVGQLMQQGDLPSLNRPNTAFQRSPEENGPNAQEYELTETISNNITHNKSKFMGIAKRIRELQARRASKKSVTEPSIVEQPSSERSSLRHSPRTQNRPGLQMKYPGLQIAVEQPPSTSTVRIQRSDTLPLQSIDMRLNRLEKLQYPNETRACDEKKRKIAPRSRKGCWTCRIRHKACPENKPVCRECVRLGLTCDYSQERPSYMMSDAEAEKKLRQIREITSRCKRGRGVARERGLVGREKK